MKHLIFLHLITLCMNFMRESSGIRLDNIDIPGQGTIMGKEISLIRTRRMAAYLGIPYAQPPVGELRFSPPVSDPLPSWEGVRNATEYAPACLQGDFKKISLPFVHFISNVSYQTDEDCLYLNVFVPVEKPPAEGFTTIVWFHPGNFTNGYPAMWNPYTLVHRHRVIVVTFAYRLNIMGFFNTNDGEASGNYGLMDQQAALTWVKDKIKVFGGNPNNICLMGYESGAVSIGLQMINKQSQGLFTKAIIMSGNILHPSAVKYSQDDKELLDNLASNFGCYREPTSYLLNCLKRVSAEALLSVTSNIDWKPVINHGLNNSTTFISEPPKNFFERGDYYKVPILTGYTDMEEVLSFERLSSDEEISQEFIPSLLADVLSKDIENINSSSSCIHNLDHILDSVLFFYTPTIPISDPNKARKLVADCIAEKNVGSSTYLLASYISKHQPTYVYRFDTKPYTDDVKAELQEWISVPHLFDLIYVWGMPGWVFLPDGEWDTRDKRVADVIMTMWTSFATSSNPTDTAVYPIAWNRFTKKEPGILIIDRNFVMSNLTNFNYKAMEFWNDYYPKVVAITMQCCNATEVEPTP